MNTNPHKKPMLTRIITIILAIIIGSTALILALHWNKIQETGELCIQDDKCMTIAPAQQGEEMITPEDNK